MKSLNMKIGTQMLAGFAVMLFFVVLLGVVSYKQAGKIHTQTVTLYDHPLKVRRAMGELKYDIVSIHRNMKDLFLISGESRISKIFEQNELFKSNAFQQIDILYMQYLGPRTDIDSLKQNFVVWNTMRDETIRLFREGKKDDASARTLSDGIAGSQVEILFKGLQKIDNFSLNKGDSLFAASEDLYNSLKNQLILLITAILLLSLVVSYTLLRSIRKPLKILTDVSQQFGKGDMDARSSYDSENEFGILSDSFNDLAESIQIKTELDEKFAALAVLMLSEYDVKKFFQATLNALAAHTGSQMAAIYLLSGDKKTYEHFESIGVDSNARKSFTGEDFEGEFGSVIASRKVQHIKNIPEDTKFVFSTVAGKFIPREIITIPIMADNEVVAVISLASVNIYNEKSVQLIERILVTLCARVEGIMAYHKMKEQSAMLENQNRELEAQKTELAGQSAELLEQNTELEMQKRQLDEVSRLKTNFLSNMSHELRTPLNSVIALSGVLNRKLAKKIPDEEYSYLEVIERNGKHLLTLINDILDISRIEAGKEEIEIVKFSISDLISEVVSMIKPQADINKIELIFSPDDLNLNITSDPGKCRHILQNLIGNAVKFTEKGKVRVIASQNCNNLVITVTDTGIGIAEDHIPHIFDEFRQADGSTSRKFGGTGLGLAIAKKYTNLLGGSLTVKSVIDKGSEFTITLPIEYRSENKIIDEPKIPALNYNAVHNISETTAKTILIVDDSEPAIIQIKDFLEESGYHIQLSRGGAEALESISKSIPDAIILDLMMPGIDGFKVLKSIREEDRTAHIPVLILTAKHITKEELKFLKRNNIHQLIQKGDVNRIELTNAVAGMVFKQKEEIVEPKREINKIIGKPSVLIVEDNSDNMITAKALLGDKYFVFEAVNGEEGIAMTKKHKPDLVLMDIALPVTDGIKSFIAIRKDPALNHIPVIALTASAMTNDREAILAHGFNAYIAKPIDEKKFYKTINEVLYGE